MVEPAELDRSKKPVKDAAGQDAMIAKLIVMEQQFRVLLSGCHCDGISSFSTATIEINLLKMRLDEVLCIRDAIVLRMSRQQDRLSCPENQCIMRCHLPRLATTRSLMEKTCVRFTQNGGHSTYTDDISWPETSTMGKRENASSRNNMYTFVRRVADELRCRDNELTSARTQYLKTEECSKLNASNGREQHDSIDAPAEVRYSRSNRKSFNDEVSEHLESDADFWLRRHKVLKRRKHRICVALEIAETENINLKGEKRTPDVLPEERIERDALRDDIITFFMHQLNLIKCIKELEFILRDALDRLSNGRALASTTEGIKSGNESMTTTAVDSIYRELKKRSEEDIHVARVTKCIRNQRIAVASDTAQLLQRAKSLIGEKCQLKESEYKVESLRIRSNNLHANYNDAMHRSIELRRLERWWVNYGQKQLQHERNQAGILLKRQIYRLGVLKPSVIRALRSKIFVPSDLADLFKDLEFYANSETHVESLLVRCASVFRFG